MFDHDDIAILRLNLADTVPAYALTLLVGIVDDLYFGHLWLDLAEASIEDLLFPDEYAPTPEETLYVSRLEIGTPNFIEFLGLADPRVQVFTYLGGVGGLIAAGKGVVSIVKGIYEIRKLHLETKQLENAINVAKAQGRMEEHAIDLNNPEADLAIRARPLYYNHRISLRAAEHKIEMNEDIKRKAAELPPEFCRESSLTVIKSAA